MNRSGMTNIGVPSKGLIGISGVCFLLFLIGMFRFNVLKIGESLVLLLSVPIPKSISLSFSYPTLTLNNSSLQE
ncbi:unnamed protein product [marine sediment metagenome]|uniref:Uncharacterized protein n=1 Tax=marine sediment metagenome TaxID=412755 RepID=X1V791_9ZZZZ